MGECLVGYYSRVACGSLMQLLHVTIHLPVDHFLAGGGCKLSTWVIPKTYHSWTQNIVMIRKLSDQNIKT